MIRCFLALCARTCLYDTLHQTNATSYGMHRQSIIKPIQLDPWSMNLGAGGKVKNPRSRSLLILGQLEVGGKSHWQHWR